MKRTFLFVLFLALLTLGASSALAATPVPLSTGEIPAVPSAPNAFTVTRSVQSGSTLSVSFDQALPSESLVEFVALNGSGQEVSVAYTVNGDSFDTNALPSGGQWLRIDLAWVSGGVNATAQYSVGGSLTQKTRFDSAYNEYVYDASGSFFEFRNASNGIWTRFDVSGNATCYSYSSGNMRVWFDFSGAVLWATYDDGTYSCTWESGTGWFIEAPSGNLAVMLSLDPTSVSPLLIVAEPSPTPEVVWYPDNTIALAGLSLQEASTSLPDKWYNVVPVDLTRQGRQTYELTISNARFIGQCHVDIWGDEVTVTCELLGRSGIEYKSFYGRWFTNLSEITSTSIESNEDGFAFGETLSISDDLGGADVALLFIRCKATYRQPFRDGTELERYWRNTPSWKQYREDLTYLMQFVER